jgi:molybdopterin converting factor small subunit
MTVTFYGLITRYTNGDSSYTPSTHATLRGLLKELGKVYGKQFVSFITGNESCIILINGKGIMLSGGLNSAISIGDRIEILPFVDAG